MSKKFTAIALSIIMVVTTIFGGMTVSAEGATNYITDGGFDNPDTSVIYKNQTTHNLTPINSSTLNNKWGAGSASGVVYMEVMNEDGNNYAGVRFRGANGSQFYVRPFAQMVSLEPSTEYTLSFTARKTPDCTVDILAGVVAGEKIYTSEYEGQLGSAIKSLAIDSTTWKEYTLNFTTKATDVNYGILFGNNNINVNSSTEGFDLDNVSLYKASEIILIEANTNNAGGTATGGGAVIKGQTATLTATAKSGYEFTGWSDGETAATRTITATANANYTANFVKITADYIPNGDFESENWAISDYWAPLSTEATAVEAASPTDPSDTVAYFKGGAKATMASKDTITLKNGHTYYISFNSYIAETVTGNGTQFYRMGLLIPGKTDLAGASFYDYGGVYNASAQNSKIGEWYNGFGFKYTHNAADAEAQIVFGTYNNECTSDWYVDDIVAYDMADVLTLNATAENGAATISNKTPFKGETVTLTATSAGINFAFEGWFVEGEETPVSMQETYSFKATENVNYVARYENNAANLVVNGDFEETTNISFGTNLTGTNTKGVWGRLGTGVAMFSHNTQFVEGIDGAILNGTGYAAATVPDGKYIRTFGQYVTLKADTDYVLEFIAKNNLNVAVYAGVIKKIDSGSYGITIAGTNANTISANSGVMIPANTTEWTRYVVRFNSGDYEEAAVAFGGNASSNMVGYNFAIDNVVLTKATNYDIKSATVSDFEKGTDGWIATSGATVESVNISDTPLSNFNKYFGNKVGVLAPAAEGDVFTSPAISTVAGKTYDVVIYARHNSPDNSRGKYNISAGGNGESLFKAGYGASDSGEFEDNNGFAVTPLKIKNGTVDFGTFAKIVLTFTATETTHKVSFTTVVASPIYVDGFTVYAHDDVAEYAQDKMAFNGIAIRTTGVQGLRFKNQIGLGTLSNMGSYAKVVEYGTLAIKEKYRNGNDLIVEDLTSGKYAYVKDDGVTTSCRLKVGVAYNTANGTNVRFSVTPYGVTFTGVLTGISEENYGAEYTTRAYAKVQFADGTYTYVYGDHNTASIDAVAKYIVDNKLESDEVREYIQNNILNK